MKKWMIRAIALCLLAPMLLLSACTGKDAGSGSEKGDGGAPASQSETPAKEADPSTAGDAAWMLSLKTRDLDGKPFDGSVLKNAKLTMVNLWATWCGPCVTELPALAKLPNTYQPEDFQLVGILVDGLNDKTRAVDEKAVAAAKKLLADAKATYPSLIPEDQIIKQFLSSDGLYIPLTLYINGEGKVLDTVSGSMDFEAMKEKIDGLLRKV